MLQRFIGSDNEAQISIYFSDAECRECVVRGRGIASGTKRSGFRSLGDRKPEAGGLRLGRLDTRYRQ